MSYICTRKFKSSIKFLLFPSEHITIQRISHRLLEFLDLSKAGGGARLMHCLKPWLK